MPTHCRALSWPAKGYVWARTVELAHSARCLFTGTSTDMAAETAIVRDLEPA